MTQTVKRVTLVTLAIAEMVTLAVATGTVGYFLDQTGKSEDEGLPGSGQLVIDIGIFGRHEFLLFATGASYFVAIGSLVIAVGGLQDKMHCAVMMLTAHAFCTIALLVSSALLAKTTRTYDKKLGSISICKRFENSSGNAQCYQLVIGVVFGFVSMVLFIGDTLVYLFTLIRNAENTSFVNMAHVTQ